MDYRASAALYRSGFGARYVRTMAGPDQTPYVPPSPFVFREAKQKCSFAAVSRHMQRIMAAEVTFNRCLEDCILSLPENLLGFFVASVNGPSWAVKYAYCNFKCSDRAAGKVRESEKQLERDLASCEKYAKPQEQIDCEKKPGHHYCPPFTYGSYTRFGDCCGPEKVCNDLAGCILPIG